MGKQIENIIYKVEISQLKENVDITQYEKHKFKDLGYLTLLWAKYKADKNGEFQWNWHGFITTNELKERIGEKQYSKFCQGKREFIIQRNAKMGKPSKKDYGYVKPSTFIFESKGWTIEGGKEAYHKDLLEYRKLIVAAPELLEALRAAKAVLESQGINAENSIVSPQYRQILSAIKKATE